MNTLCKIREVCRSIARFEESFGEKFGITLNEGMMMCTLRDEHRLSPGDISERMGLSMSQVSKIVDQLMEKGHISGSLGENDRSMRCYSLTDSGVELLESINCSKHDMPRIPRNAVETD